MPDAVMPQGARKSIAILGTRGIPAAYGGFETFAEELSVRLAAKGIPVTVFCEQGTEPGPETYRGVQLRHVAVTRMGPLTTILFDLRCLWQARQGFEVVYMLGYGAAPGLLITRLWGQQAWLNVDGVEWKRAKWGRLAKLYFKAMEWCSAKIPDRLVADADAIRAHLLGRHRKLPPCSVIPYGSHVVETSSPEPLQEWGLHPGGYYLVVCRLEPENHVREIIQGFLASATERPLVVVGNHHAPSPYAAQLRSLGGPRVRFIGTVFDQRKLSALRFHAFAYFHGHSVGGTNPSLLEAMGCGNAVIAHDNPFNREVLGELGRFFQSPGDIPGLVSAFEREPPGEAALRQGRTRSRIRAAYDWDLIAQAYLDLLG